MPDSEADKGKLEKQEASQPIERVPDSVKSLFSIFGSRQPVFPPFMEKINEQHITKVLDYSEEKDKRDFADIQSERKYNFAKFLLILIAFLFLFVFLTLYLVDKDKELYRDVLKIGLGFLSGAGLAGGVAYHLGRRAASKGED